MHFMSTDSESMEENKIKRYDLSFKVFVLSQRQCQHTQNNATKIIRTQTGIQDAARQTVPIL